MLLGPASTSGNADRTANRRPRCIFRRSTEKKNPLNIQFERQVAALESRQQEQRQRSSTIQLYLALSTLSSHCVENGDSQVSSKSTPVLDGLDPSLSSSVTIIHFDIPEESLRRCLINSSRPSVEDSPKSDKASDYDFSVNTFTKTSVDVKQTTRKKRKKKNKKHKRGHCKKLSDASEIQCRQRNNASSCAIDVDVGQSLTLLSNHVADELLEDTSSAESEMQCRHGTSPSTPLPNPVTNKLFKDSSPCSSVREVSVERSDSDIGNEYDGSLITSTSSTSCSDEMDLSQQSCYSECCEQSSSTNLRCVDSASNSTLTDSSLDGHCTDSSWNFSDDTENLLIDRNERPCDQSKLTDYGGFKYGGDCFKNCAGPCSGTQEMQFCSNAGGDGDFHLVISRKRARKNRKMQHLGNCNLEHTCGVRHGRNGNYANLSSKRGSVELNTMDCSCRPSNVVMQPQHGVASKVLIQKPSKVRSWIPHEVTLNDYMTGANVNRLLIPKENSRGKSPRYSSLREAADGSFSEEKNGGTAKILPGVVCSGETDVNQMASSSASELMVQKGTEECTSEGLPTKEKLRILLPEDAAVICTDSILQFPSMNSPDPLNKSSCVDPKEQSKIDNTVSSIPCSIQGDLHTQAEDSQSPSYTSDCLNTSGLTESGLEVVCHDVSAVRNCSLNQQRFGISSLQLDEMIKAANDAYKVQVASDGYLISGHPIADFEVFIHTATPVICPVTKSPSQYQISSISLRSVWEWYEEPGSYGLEVEIQKSLNSKRSTCCDLEFCAYFLPSLSAIQLFGQSKKNFDHRFDRDDGDFLLSQPNEAHSVEPSLSVQDHGELLFEYFESEHPSLRPPIFEKIKQLVSGENLSGHQIFGDPKKLENLKLSDLHPASWFCVAWYPICRIPEGNFRASFLTYHSLGKVVPQTCSPDTAGGPTHVVSPVVGFWSYNDKGENWFQLRDPELKTTSLDEDPKTGRTEVLKERLKTLRHGASVMSSTVIPKANGESTNRHSDYEFFRSRSNWGSA